jgi:hypothetical protein
LKTVHLDKDAYEIIKQAKSASDGFTMQQIVNGIIREWGKGEVYSVAPAQGKQAMPFRIGWIKRALHR